MVPPLGVLSKYYNTKIKKINVNINLFYLEE